MAQKLITKAANRLIEQGYDQLTTTHQTRRRGIRHTTFTRNGEEFHLGAKEYAYKGLASFAENQVEHALERDAMLVLYIDTEEIYYVFDPEYVDKHGEIIESGGRQVTTQRWVNLPLEHGADLTGYVYGIERPDTLAGDNATLGAFR